jgi:hypothetical protein
MKNLNDWIDKKNDSLRLIIDACNECIEKLDLSNPDRRTKNWVTYRYYAATKENYEQAIQINESKRIWK